jgi:hypothetical protein
MDCGAQMFADDKDTVIKRWNARAPNAAGIAEQIRLSLQVSILTNERDEARARSAV